jgi:hypothetical protein
MLTKIENIRNNVLLYTPIRGTRMMPRLGTGKTCSLYGSLGVLMDL